VRLNAHDLEGLRRLADDAQRDGAFTDAEHLRELLDSREDLEEIFNQDPEVQDVETVVECVKGFAASKENFETVADALQCAADELGPEAENYDDQRIAIESEIDKLKSIKPELRTDMSGVVRISRADLSNLFEAVAGLKDVVETLKGTRDRLLEIKKAAVAGLKEAGR
jgi:cell fate (sporulation/competence/biofilm development) regulator YlbF (YheA/YmcA/DUF963 family)